MQTKDKIEKLYRIPCGSTDVSADRVCRKSVGPFAIKILDRLTEEILPEPLSPDKLPRDLKVTSGEDNLLIPKENREERKSRLIEEGKLRAEVRAAIKQYQESLQGNSKLLQDTTGKIQPW